MRTSLVLLAVAAGVCDGFSVLPSVPALRSSGAASVSSLQMQKGSGGGFGKKVAPQKKTSAIAKDRKPAADRYDKIAASGAPEFNVFFRAVGAGDEDGMMRGGWYPVGLVTAPSSMLVNKAIFTNEDALLQGAWNVHSVQIKRQFTTAEGKKPNNWKDMKNCDLEYGFQMKDFPDEEVTLAEVPREPSAIEEGLGGLMNKFQNAINWVPEDKDK
mmetsp:Transcript_4962/g.11896  ORF Transcript_4962/g.11896 Transcript_4962/m.11896 type:complete len:214 (-) Transcript_4962:74-715(-)|eukprot:CAMPEP_0173434424 /NCGR_PEP_ID=MMETSP1357-20121228/12881_1 /TAXON_ID=77926 /ORGANISM="Hemiselmis rufescens, Strain PCC563" /LENGTH=213 /DNA_ID=CAMNT_0014399277 /DNA_START=22 /DNA_END=663 /DNA_ORIENTATION=+